MSISGAFIAALSAALAYGTADYFGGRSAVRFGGLTTSLRVQLRGLTLIAPLLLLPLHEPPSGASWLIGTGVGLCSAIGLAALFTALARGGVISVAPAVAVIGAITASTLAILLLDAALSLGRCAGAVLGLLGVSFGGIAPSGEARSRDNQWQIVLLVVTAGISSGLALFLLALVQEAQLMWALIAERVVCASVLILFGQRLGSPSECLVVDLGAWITAAGYVFATWMYVVSAAEAPFGAVIATSQYPLVTVLLGICVGREHLRLSTGIGLFVSCLGLGLIAAN